MTYPVWEAGKLYLPGALIRPATAAASAPQTLANPGFESGDTGWTKQTAWTITQAAQTFDGTWSAKFNGGAPASVINATNILVTPGQTVSASCRVWLTTASSPSSARMLIRWYTSANAQISHVAGVLHNSGAGFWKQLSVSGAAPAGAAYGTIELSANKRSTQGTIFADGFTVTAPTPLVTSSGLVFRAVQAAAGLSGSTEPVWPAVNGQQVIDNQVTWEAVNATRVVWQASPVLLSGAAEPTWPTTPGAVVIDGGIAWQCRSTHIQDKNCPNSKVVAIVSGKVFAADKDIVRFCATANPLDWTTPQDAGYLPTGLQQANANDVLVLNQYRSHLVAMNASSFQMWQVDPDPANMAILDHMDGVGSTFQGAAQSVANELLYLSQQGVRSVGVAGATENMQAGDIGSPIDPIVRTFLDGGPSMALSAYYPGAGQYWMCIDAASGGATSMYFTGNAPDTTVGATYSYTYRATGGRAPITYAITSGVLPAGLSLSAAGVVSGIPTTEETRAFTVTATDANLRTATLNDSIAVSTALTAYVATAIQVTSGMPPAIFQTTENTISLAVNFPSLVYPRTASLASNSRILAIGMDGVSSPNLATYSFDGTTLQSYGTFVPALSTSTDIGRCSMTPDATWLARVEPTRKLDIWKRTTDTFTLLTQPASLPDSIAPTNGNHYECLFSPSASMLIVARRTEGTTAQQVYVYSRSGDTFALVANQPATQPVRRRSNAMAFTPDGSVFVLCSDTTAVANGDIYVYSVSGTAFTLVSTTSNTEGYGTSCAFSHDGRYLAIGWYNGGVSMANGGVRIFKRDGTVLNELASPLSNRSSGCWGCAFSPDNSQLVLIERAATALLVKRSGDTFTLTSSVAVSNGVSGTGASAGASISI